MNHSYNSSRTLVKLENCANNKIIKFLTEFCSEPFSENKDSLISNFKHYPVTL